MMYRLVTDAEEALRTGCVAAILPRRVSLVAVVARSPATRISLLASRRAPRTLAAPDCWSVVPALRCSAVAPDYPAGTCLTNACTAASTRPHSSRYGHVSDRCNQIRRTPVTTTAPIFHSRCRNVLTVAVATSGTAATASRHSTTLA